MGEPRDRAGDGRRDSGVRCGAARGDILFPRALPDDGTVPSDLVAKFWIDHGDLLRLVLVLNRAGVRRRRHSL